LWLVVLSLACEEPMHPYRMQALIKQRGQDMIANVAQRNSVYQTIDALLRAGLLEVRETERHERRPERTIYEATDAGRRALRLWVSHGLATPAREFPEFPAVLANMFHVTSPDELRTLLDARAKAQEARLAGMETPVPHVPRLFLLENEFAAAMTRAEIAWLRAISADLRAGRLVFPGEEDVRHIGPELGGPSEEAIRRLRERGARKSTASAPASRRRAPKKPTKRAPRS
jgi:DNA-binding PadR family transcriptional regulator